jgi:hypothetical protein
MINIETKLQKLGLEGTAIKLGRFTNLEERIKEIFFSLQDTLVIIGDDELFSKTLNLVAKNKKKPVIGYLPIRKETNITRNLGLPVGEDSVMTLASRRLETIDLGRYGENFFLEKITFANNNTSLILDKNYKIFIPASIDRVEILNMACINHRNFNFNNIKTNDGLLNLLLIEKKKKKFTKLESLNSQIKVKTIEITSETEIEIDSYRKEKTPIDVGVLKKGIKLITGKNRLINR